MMASVGIPERSEHERFHAYIFHCDQDRGYARQLVERLRTDGFQCGASYEVDPGAPTPLSIAEAVNQSKRSFTIVSKDMMKNKWFDFQIANSRAKANEKNEVTFIPIIHKVPSNHIPTYVKEIFCLESSADDFYQRLKCSITESTPLRATIPVGNVAHGLAWSYFYGFLSFVLPGINDRLRNSQFANREPKLLPKLIIVLPETCNCPAQFCDVDDCITRGKEDFVAFNALRATKFRSYRNTIYKVKDPDNGEEFYVAMEYATPLLTLYDMEQGRMSTFNGDAMVKQMELFQQKMKEILEHPCNRHCNNKAVLVRYKDFSTTNQPQERLAKVLTNCVRRELQASG